MAAASSLCLCVLMEYYSSAPVIVTIGIELGKMFRDNAY